MKTPTCASKNKCIRLIYKDDVHTIVPCFDFNPNVIKNEIETTIQYYPTVKGARSVVQHIDDKLFYWCSTQQILIPSYTRLDTSIIIYIDYPYDLGYNESEEDLLYMYPEYKFPYNED
jgi:uncharacterized protein (DUF1499 family)